MVAPAYLVGLGGALGALARHGVSTRLDRETFPVGTFAVNALGSFALGLLVFAGVGSDATLTFGVGFCGSFTTFSSFSFDTVRLIERGAWRRGGAYALGTLAAAFLGIGLAWSIVTGVGPHLT